MRFLLSKKNYFIACFAFLFITSLTVAQNKGDTVFTWNFEKGADSKGEPIGAEAVPYSDFVKVKVDSTNQHSGKYCATLQALNDTSAVEAELYLPQATFKLEKKVKYLLSVWIKYDFSKDSANSSVGVYDNGGKQLIKTLKGKKDWTRYYDTVEFTGTSEKLDFYMSCMGGKVWVDDIVIIKASDTPPNIVSNPSAELPDASGSAPLDWWVTDWGGSNTKIGLPSEDTLNYIWDNTQKHSGSWSLRVQISKSDLTKSTRPKDAAGFGSFDGAWGTNSFQFQGGGIYELSYWVMTKNFNKGAVASSYNRIRISVGYNNVNLTTVTDNTFPNWIQVKDTIIMPIDQQTNFYFNDFRFRLGGEIDKDTLAMAWIDDVQFKLLGMQAPVIPEVNVTDNKNGTVTITWTGSSGIGSPVYHILKQPKSDGNGNYQKNLLKNPGFEEPDASGTRPAFWTTTRATTGDPAIHEWPSTSSQPPKNGGNFCVSIEPQSATSTKGISAEWDQVYNKVDLNFQGVYMYGAMMKFKDVVVTGGNPKISDATDPTPSDSINIAGVHIKYDRYSFEFQNPLLVKLGWSCPRGTSDWKEVSLPLLYDQAATRYHIGIGIGSFGNGRSAMNCTGKIWIDNAFVVPFEEVKTTTSNSVTLTNDTKDSSLYYAVWVEDLSKKYLPSPAMLGVNKRYLTAAEGLRSIPLKYELSQNYPNPFNPTTKIKYTLPVASKVKLVVYDILGREAKTIINDLMQPAGSYTVDFSGVNLSSGAYFYRLETGDKSLVRKMMLLK